MRLASASVAGVGPHVALRNRWRWGSLGTNDAAASAALAPKTTEDIPVLATAAPRAAVRSSARRETSGASEDRSVDVVVAPLIRGCIGAAAPLA